MNSKFPASIDTQRLTLRPYVRENIAQVLQLIERNRTRLLQSFGPIALDINTTEEVAEFIRSSDALWQLGTMFQYGLYTRDQDRLIGQIKIKHIDRESDTLELSYFIDLDWLRQGYARESVLAMIRCAFEEMHFRTIVIRIIASNRASLELARRLGFELDAVCENSFTCGLGEVHDLHCFILKKPDRA